MVRDDQYTSWNPFTLLPFGISLALAIFQKAIDTILQGLPPVICDLDDMLVTGWEVQSRAFAELG